MADMMDTLFGPLPRDYCLWFYFLSIFGFVWLVLFSVVALVIGITKKRGMDYYMGVFGVAIGYAIFYFQNRLLHSMCVAK